MAAAPASGDVTIDLRARDPVAALPAVSSDGVNFLRPYRRWTSKCKKPDLHVEMGGIDRTVTDPEYASAQLLGCNEPVTAYEGNVSMVNESLRETRCTTAPDRATLTARLPASFVAASTFQVTVTGAADSALVLVDGRRRGERRMQLAGTPLEVHAWYLVDRGINHAIAVQVSVKQKDGVVAEQWIDVWLDTPPAKPTPVDIARAWLRTSSRYAPTYDPQAVEVITIKQLPRTLVAHKKALSKPGTALVLYDTDEGTLVLGIRANKIAVTAETPPR